MDNKDNKENIATEYTGQELRETQWADHVSDYINDVVSELVAIEMFSKQFPNTVNQYIDSNVHYGNVLLELATILGNNLSGERDKFLQLVQKVFEEYCKEAFKQSVFKLDIKISPFSWLTEGFFSDIFIDDLILRVLRGLEVGKEKYGVDVIPTFVEQDTWSDLILESSWPSSPYFKVEDGVDLKKIPTLSEYMDSTMEEMSKPKFDTGQKVIKRNDPGSGSWIILAVTPMWTSSGSLETVKYLIENLKTKEKCRMNELLLAVKESVPMKELWNFEDDPEFESCLADFNEENLPGLCASEVESQDEDGDEDVKLGPRDFRQKRQKAGIKTSPSPTGPGVKTFPSPTGTGVKIFPLPTGLGVKPSLSLTGPGVKTSPSLIGAGVKTSSSPTLAATVLPSNADSFKTFDANSMGSDGDRFSSHKCVELMKKTSTSLASSTQVTPDLGPHGDGFNPIETSTPIPSVRFGIKKEAVVGTPRRNKARLEIDTPSIQDSITPVNLASVLATTDAAPFTSKESGTGISSVPARKMGLITDQEDGTVRGSFIIHESLEGFEHAEHKSSCATDVPVAKKGQAATKCTSPFFEIVEETEFCVEDDGSISEIKAAAESMGPPKLMKDKTPPGLTEDEDTDFTDNEEFIKKRIPRRMDQQKTEVPPLTEDETPSLLEADEFVKKKKEKMKSQKSPRKMDQQKNEDLTALTDSEDEDVVEKKRINKLSRKRSSGKQKSSSNEVKIENARGARRILRDGSIIIPEKKGCRGLKTNKAEMINQPFEAAEVQAEAIKSVEAATFVYSDAPLTDLGDLSDVFDDIKIPDEALFKIPQSIWNMDFETAFSGQIVNETEAAEGNQIVDETEAAEGNQLVDETEAAEGNQLVDETEATEGNQIVDETEAAEGNQIVDEAGEESYETGNQIAQFKEWLTECKENIYDVDVIDADSAVEEIQRIQEDWSEFKIIQTDILELESRGVAFQYQHAVQELKECCEHIDESFKISVEALQLMEENFRTLGIRVEDNFDGGSDFTPRFFTDAEIKAISTDSDGQSVTTKKNQILGLFKAFLHAAGEQREITAIPYPVLSRALGSFWYTLTKKDGKHHDTSTLLTSYSRLNVVIKGLLGGVDPLKHQDFEIYRTLRTAKLRKSKEQPGNGQKRHRADMLHPEEVRYLFYIGVLNPATPWGILRTIYVYLVGICNNRAVADNNRLTLGDINIKYDSLGRVEYADIRLQKQKRDQGDREQPVKRPRIVPLEDKRRCFFSAWFPYMEYRKMLGDQFLEEGSFVFLQPRITTDYEGTGNRCLFKPEYLKEAQMKHLVKNMCIEGRLRIEGRKICNSSLRLMTFKNQMDTGITESQAQALDGHLSVKTRREYDRGNEDNMDAFGAALACAATGSRAILPRPAGVKLTDHLHGPLTVKSGDSIDMSRSTLSVRRKTDEERIVTPGSAASRVLPAFALAFDDKEPDENISELSVAYTAHRIEKYDDLFGGQATYGDEDDFNQMFGGVDPEEKVPEIPKLGEPNGVRTIPRKEYCTDGEQVGVSSQVWREPRLLKEIKNQATKRAVSPGSAENPPPKKKVSPPKPKKKKEEIVHSVGDIVFARSTKTPKSWPGQIEQVFHNSTGQVSGYRVQLFGLKEVEDVIPKKVDPFNSSTYKKYSNPSMNKKAKRFGQLFPGALTEAAEKSGLGDLVNNKENDGGGVGNLENNKENYGDGFGDSVNLESAGE